MQGLRSHLPNTQSSLSQNPQAPKLELVCSLTAPSLARHCGTQDSLQNSYSTTSPLYFYALDLENKLAKRTGSCLTRELLHAQLLQTLQLCISSQPHVPSTSACRTGESTKGCPSQVFPSLLFTLDSLSGATTCANLTILLVAVLSVAQVRKEFFWAEPFVALFTGGRTVIGTHAALDTVLPSRWPPVQAPVIALPWTITISVFPFPHALAVAHRRTVSAVVTVVHAVVVPPAVKLAARAVTLGAADELGDRGLDSGSCGSAVVRSEGGRGLRGGGDAEGGADGGLGAEGKDSHDNGEVHGLVERSTREQDVTLEGICVL